MTHQCERQSYNACDAQTEAESRPLVSGVERASVSLSPPPTTRPQTNSRRQRKLESIFLGTCVLTIVVLLVQCSPSATEMEWSEHYYGASFFQRLPGYSLPLRWAQHEADVAQLDLTVPLLEQLPHGRQLRARREMHKADNKHLPVGCESTVMIVRHCEKSAVAEHCAYNGFERSVYLSTLFGSRWPVPSFAFAENPGGRHNRHKMNFREVETIGPTMVKYNLSVDDSYTDYDLHKMARTILGQIGSGHWCGKMAVVVWKHSSIAKIGRLLGCGPGQGCPTDYHGKTFDEVWEIKYKYDKFEHSNRKRYFETHNPEPRWKIFGSVQYENFDPLAVSNAYHDYPVGGTPTSGRWQNSEYEFPERHSRNDNDGWHMTRVSFARTSRDDETVMVTP